MVRRGAAKLANAGWMISHCFLQCDTIYKYSSMNLYIYHDQHSDTFSLPPLTLYASESWFALFARSKMHSNIHEFDVKKA